MPNLKRPLEKENFQGWDMRPPEAPRLGREKLPPGKLTKDPTQRYKAILALGLLSGAAMVLGDLGEKRREEAEEKPGRGQPKG